MPAKGKKQQYESDDDDVHESDNARENMEKLLQPDYSENFIKQLPANVRTRVFGLKGLQKDYSAIHEKYVEEMKELETRYEALYAPFYEKRKNIVQGKVEPTQDEIAKGSKVVEVKEEGEEDKPDANAPKGIPNFWLTALKNNEVVDEFVFQRDEDCLKFLNDITAKNFDDPNQGFSLTFHFDENPYFTNTELTKTYHLAEDDEILIEKCEGCEIHWKDGQDLTVTIKKKKQRQKGGKNTRVVTQSEPCESFFNFFNPPKMPEEDDDEDEDEDAMEELEERIEHDYELGRMIKDRIIPKAIDWFTGEAITTMEFQLGNEGSPDDDDDDDDERPRITNAPKAQAPECKQQ